MPRVGTAGCPIGRTGFGSSAVLELAKDGAGCPMLVDPGLHDISSALLHAQLPVLIAGRADGPQAARVGLEGGLKAAARAVLGPVANGTDVA